MDKKMNDPKERITQERASWEVRREDTARAKITSEGSQANDKMPAGKENNIARGKGKKRKLYLKKSVRRTVGSLLLATSVVVAAVPVGTASADAGGVYRGSTKKVSDFTVSTNNVQKDLPVPTSGTHFGGYPMIPPEKDEYGNYKKTDIGGHGYYIVDSNGYKTTDYVRPIYALDSSKSDIEGYFETNNGADDAEDVYIPPSGKLNLVTGYITETTSETDWTSVDESKWWTYDGRLYVPQIKKFDLKTKGGNNYSLYGKRICIYDKVDVITHTVNFYVEGSLHYSTQVRHGEKVTGYPDAPTPIEGGRTFLYWSPDPTTLVINADQDFTAHYTDPTPTPTPTTLTLGAPLSLSPKMLTSPVDSEGTPDETTVDETGEGENAGTQEAVPSTSPELSETETETGTVEAAPASNTEPESGTGSGEEPVTIVEELHEIENADAGSAGMTGILLQWYPSDPTDPSRIEYKDDPSQIIYVCDEIAGITNIRNDVFQNTKNVRVVDFPSNILNIGNNSFKGSGLTSVTLGDGLGAVGASAFEDCLDLKTATYSNNMSLTDIGSRAFANSGLSELHDGSSGFAIPYTVKNIGDGAFLGTKMSSLDFSKVSGCTVGNCAFAQCKSLTDINLDYYDGSSLTISNLGTVQGLFCENPKLVSAVMPTGMADGTTLQPGTFGSCEGFNHITFKDGAGTFSDGEFDNYLITVEGPAPSNSGNYLNPTNNGSRSYTSAVKPDDPTTPVSDNDYVYRYYTADGKMHEIANEKAYEHSDDFFTDKTAVSKTEFIFDVDESDFTLSAYFDRGTITPKKDLEIGNNIGKRNDGDITILKIGNSVFETNTTIQYLQLDSNLNSIGDSAFKNTQIVRLWANVDGTAFEANSFADNSVMERATFAYAGEGGSTLGDNSFGNTPVLNNVDFYDDNITTGDKNKYARFFSGSIAANSFYTEGRTDEITFKGPMIKDYAPWEFAINKDSKISNNTVYTMYYSGNPWNLTAQYQEQPFVRTYVDYSNSGSDTVGDPPTKYTDKKEFHLTGSDFETGNGGVCLLKYPNMSSYADNDDIDNTDGTGTRTISSLLSESNPTQMMLDCLDRANNIAVPYGIDYIDLVKTKRTDYTAGDEYYKFVDDPTDANYYLYRKDGGAYYDMFRYNPDLLSVTFEDGSVTDYPDRMFEGATNLDHVVFNNDVHNLGYLPFYMPDTEGYVPSYSTYLPFSYREGSGNNLDEENRSHLASVVFNAEGDGSSASNNNLYYSITNGIIRGVNNSDTILVQICPSKGDPVLKSNPKGEKFFGSASITESDLAGLTKYSPYAAKDCDMLTTVNFPADGCYISYGCFEDCDKLSSVYMPNKFVSVGDKAFAYISNNNMQVTFPYREAQLNKLPFEPAKKTGDDVPYVVFHVNNDAEGLQDYASKHANIEWLPNTDTLTITYLDPKDSSYKQEKTNVESGSYGNNYPPDVAPSYPEGTYTWEGTEGESWNSTKLIKDTIFLAKEVEKVNITFKDSDGTVIKSFKIPYGSSLTASDYPILENLKYWSNDPGEGNPVTEDTTMTAVYKGSTSSSSTSSTSTTSSSGGGSSSSGSSSSSSRSSSSSSKSSSSSSSSSSAYPVYVSSQDTLTPAGAAAPGAGSTVYIDESTGSGSGDGSGSGGKKGSGNASVISTTGGISDTGKISATVNGSSDNYIIKITQTQEADEMGLQALHNEYGEDISPIRYLCFDISLYDSTGTNKISPVPEGLSVTLTMPIPDDLAIYGGNAKICCTSGGVMEKMQPRFTVIDGVPCMTYTCTHFSPYMVWVDTNNLTAAGIADATPKTADGIHPKWFLCLGLAAIAIVMFLKKDPEEYLKKKAA